MSSDLKTSTQPKPAISATEPDWERETLRKWWEPNRQLLKSIRAYQKWSKHSGPFAPFRKAVATIQYRFWSVVTGAEIPLNSQISGGLLLPHPNGIVIHPKASIGPNCLIFQQVTITGYVQIGGHVDIGAGAKILRKVKIGNHVKIGANAVVLSDIPSYATAVGIPARIIQQTVAESDDSSDMLEDD
ncbi:MAG: serine acetyltransferase [Oscillatoriales cyanobacterium RM1_1_9]|nr:serine acetyltransferase [Oscillatoriales cyanobacterium SM2_3_0]NJO46422.1 serine acetyltransferase [Oscillatoriales cyanobacterium RM2_1_1]NJO71861.1 serine acetyltransferase [Oscillatoriales cyanobacterium RM1_1_9]